jgi:CxxH/CxxC protein (TIGR04129 family)
LSKYKISQGGINMFVCCKEHLELAIDHFVDDFEDAPDVYQLTEIQFTEWVAPEHCEFCQDSARFLVL